MDLGQLFGVALAGSALLSGLVVGSAELYKKSAEWFGPKPVEDDDEEG